MCTAQLWHRGGFNECIMYTVDLFIINIVCVYANLASVLYERHILACDFCEKSKRYLCVSHNNITYIHSLLRARLLTFTIWSLVSHLNVTMITHIPILYVFKLCIHLLVITMLVYVHRV